MKTNPNMSIKLTHWNIQKVINIKLSITTSSVGDIFEHLYFYTMVKNISIPAIYKNDEHTNSGTESTKNLF